jgi:6-methylsalicylate decarboxylase
LGCAVRDEILTAAASTWIDNFRTDVPATADLIESFRSFYFDMALSSGPASLLALQSFARPGNSLYGSDFPYAPASVGASFTAKLDAFEDLSPKARAAIDNGGAHKLFPRLTADAAA